MHIYIYIYIYIYITHIPVVFSNRISLLRVLVCNPKFHRAFLGTLKSDIVSTKTSTINLFGFETLKLKMVLGLGYNTAPKARVLLPREPSGATPLLRSSS